MFSVRRNSRNLWIFQSMMNSKTFLSIRNYDIPGTRLTELGRSRDIKCFTDLECYSEVITAFLWRENAYHKDKTS